MKLINILNTKEEIYFIPINLPKLVIGLQVVYEHMILHDVEMYNSKYGIVIAHPIINENKCNCYGTGERIAFSEVTPIEIVEVAFLWESSEIKVVYTKDNKKILWEDGEWLI